MKRKNIFVSAVAAIGLSLGCVSCNYLDVVPPEQPSLKNTMDNHTQALGFLYDCYRGVSVPLANDWRQGINLNAGQPLPSKTMGDYHCTTDEWYMDDIQFNQNPLARALYSNTISSTNNLNDIKVYGIWISMVYQFVENLDNIGVPNGIVEPDEVELWHAEAKFLLAYYHYCMLRRYGPIMIIDKRLPLDAPSSSFPGRMHYDYCVNWICNKLDEAAEVLPPTRVNAELGRATSTICKALKARILLYAASPLFNGEFPFKEWVNKVETPGYGRDLVSNTYDREKWVNAKKASEEAIALALSAGNRELYYDSDYAEAHKLALPYVPVDDVTDDFKKAVLRMRNVVMARETEGNHEWIWSIPYTDIVAVSNYNQRVVRNPIPKSAILPQGFVSAYSTCGATLPCNLRFLTKDGYQPGNDPSFTPESEWYKSAGLQDDGSALRSHIIKLNTNREPRFYAWLGFDGGDYGTVLFMGKRPVHINMLSSAEQGFNPSEAPRDYCPTGFPMQKWIHPLANITENGTANYYINTGCLPLIRLAELYLNLAECNAELGNTQEALDNINIIRRRAGAAELTAEMVNRSGKSLLEWARDERSIELFDEMHRFFDVRRWCKGDLLGKGIRLGLNAHVANPTFEQFNKVVDAEYPYVWADRMYLYPIDDNELYSNPQFVQSPGY